MTVNASEALLNYTDDMLALLDKDLRYLAVNDAYRAMFGQPREYFLGHTIGEAFAHDQQHYLSVIHPIMESCLKGETVRFERWVPVPRLGELFLDIQYNPVRNDVGEITGIAIVGRNRTEVMRSIEALKRSEALLNRTEHMANLGGWFFNVRSGTMSWTDEMYAIHEVEKDFIPTQDNVNAFLTHAELPAVLQKINSAIQGETTEVVSSLITAKGQRKWVRTAAFPVMENGEVVSIEGILQDITELTDIQLQLQQSEEKYRNLVEETNALVWEADFTPFCFTYMSPQAEGLTGFTASEWCQPGFLSQRIPPEDEMPAMRTVEQGIRARRDFVLDYRFRKADGSLLWLHDDVKIVKDAQGKPVKLRGVMFDVTPMKEMQAGLNRALRSLENHKYILDQHAIVAITDKAGFITFVNNKFIEITGYARDELIGRNHRMFKSGLHPQSFYEKLWTTINAGQVWQGEICNYNKQGALYWVYTTIVPILDEHGEIEEFMSVRTDITELKRTEESLRRAQKMEAIGQLTGGIAHDFNNLLGIVIGNLELLELNLPGRDQVQSQIENAKNAALRGSVLTKRLLNFSHQTPVSGKTLELNKVIKGLEVLISKSLTALVDIEMQLSTTLWQVEADPGDFEDVIINLAINASDAMPKGGKLRFSTRNHEVIHPEFRNKNLVPPGKYVEITVEDTGIGMTEEVMEKIFDPYFSTKPSDKGSGLGLAMVYGFVKRSNGQIFVDSTPGQGSRFTIYLPKSRQEQAGNSDTRAAESTPKQMATGNETIMLVDDEADILKINSINLQRLGYKVLCCNNADEALELLQSTTPVDLLFTDVVMPGTLNGYELAEKAQQLRSNLKILFTTGYAKVENKVTRKDWENALIPKPYRSAELSRKIRETLDAANSG